MTEAGSSINTVIQADQALSRQEGILDKKVVIIMICVAQMARMTRDSRERAGWRRLVLCGTGG